MTDPWDQREARFTRHPIAYSALVVLLIIIAVAIVGLVGGWFSEGARIVGPDNSRAQAYAQRDDYESLLATAGNVCDAEAGAKGSSENDPQIVGGDAAFQYKATYRRIEARYNRRAGNVFEAGIVRKFPFLDDLPERAPSLSEAKAQAGC